MAEVLITLSIIGVVAAMTLPTVFTKYEKQHTVSSLKKAYTELSQAIKLSELDNGEKETWEFDAKSQNYVFFDAYLKNYMKNYEKIKFADLNKQIFTLGDRRLFTYENIYCSNFLRFPDYDLCITPEYNDEVCFFIIISKSKKKIVLGKDMFMFWLKKGKPFGPFTYIEYPSRTLLLSEHNRGCNKENGYWNGQYCAYLIVLDGWEIKKDYPW